MRRGTLAALMLIIAPRTIPAQSVLDSWENLRQLEAGQQISVVDARMKAVEGRFTAYSDDAIMLRVGSEQVSVGRAEVASVKRRERSHRGRNALLGLAIGAGAGALAGVIRGATYHEEGETGVFMLVYTPIGAGIGAAAGALVPAGEVTVYRARSLPGRGAGGNR